MIVGNYMRLEKPLLTLSIGVSCYYVMLLLKTFGPHFVSLCVSFATTGQLNSVDVHLMQVSSSSSMF